MFNKAQAKFLEKQINKATSSTTIRARIKFTSDDPGYEQEFDFTDWYEVDCALDSIDQFNTSNYPFGEVAEGDVVFIFPNDTRLLDLEEQYRIAEWQIEFLSDSTYGTLSTTNRLQGMGKFKDRFMYYVLNIENVN